MPAVYPRCRLGRIEPYVTADGYYMPCCWIGNHPKLGMLREFLGGDFEMLHLGGRTRSEVEASTAMSRIEESWEDGGLQPCVDFCGEPYDPGENHKRDHELWIDLSEVASDEEDPAP